MRPSGYSSFPPTTPASGKVRNVPTSAEIQPAKEIVSLFRKTRISPVAASAPRFTDLRNPLVAVVANHRAIRVRGHVAQVAPACRRAKRSVDDDDLTRQARA